MDSVGSWSFVMARPDLDEAVAYRLAKAVHKGEASIAAKLPQAAETTARNTATPWRTRPSCIRACGGICGRWDSCSDVTRGQRHDTLPHTRGRNSDASRATPMTTGTAMKNSIPTVSAMPSIRKATSATTAVVTTHDDSTDQPGPPARDDGGLAVARYDDHGGYSEVAVRFTPEPPRTLSEKAGVDMPTHCRL